eukprot:m.37788 g.37788  ORF g.37788 m.37788 type:complete len:602 (+) comp32443_c0_seq8:91-1896(+)
MSSILLSESIPDEMLAYVFNFLPAVDLAKTRLVCRRFNDVIGQHPRLWSGASLSGVLIESDEEGSFFSKALVQKCAAHGNLEALIKTGLSLLYGNKSRLSLWSHDCRHELACHVFCLIDSLHGREPFAWMLFRPPWANTLTCSKSAVFQHMRVKCQEQQDTPHHSVFYNVGKTLLLLEDEINGRKEDALRWMELAVSEGSIHASYQIWKIKYSEGEFDDPGSLLQCIRCLRQCALDGCLEARIELCRFYAKSYFGGISHQQAMDYIKQFALSGRQNTARSFQLGPSGITSNMRYILCDWLFEVAEMKALPSSLVHGAMDIVDDCIAALPVKRSDLQLLGITALVLITRFSNQNVITIKEAAWLTDGTYTYNDVVRMIGDVLGVLRGRIRVATAVDYLAVFAVVAQVDPLTEMYSSFLVDLSLLCSFHSESGYSLLAFSCLLLSLATTFKKSTLPFDSFCIPVVLTQCCPFPLHSLWSCALDILLSCLHGEPVCDHKKVPLRTVHDRYLSADFLKASEVAALTVEELITLKALFKSSSAAIHEDGQSLMDSSPVTHKCSCGGSGQKQTEQLGFETKMTSDGCHFCFPSCTSRLTLQSRENIT